MKTRSFKCRMCGACCRINSVKPEKCRTFPFEWTNPDSAEVHAPGWQNNEVGFDLEALFPVVCAQSTK